MVFAAGQNTLSVDVASYSKDKAGGGLTKKTVTRSMTTQAETALAVTGRIAGRNVAVQAGQDIALEGGQVSAQDQLALSAGRDLNVAAGESSDASSRRLQVGTKETLGFGTTRLTTTRDEVTVTPDVAQLSARDITLNAGRDLTLVAPTLTAETLSATAGGQLTVAAATATHELKTTSEFKTNRFNFSEVTAPLQGKNGIQNSLGLVTMDSFVTGARIKDKIKLDTAGSQRTAVVAELTAPDIALNSGGDTTLVAPRIVADTLAISAGQSDPEGRIALLGVKESTTTSGGKNSHSFVHETVRDGGQSAETLLLLDIRTAAEVGLTVNDENPPNSTQLTLNAPGGIVVGATDLAPTRREAAQAGGGASPSGGRLVDLQAQAQTLARQPGLAWLGEVAQRQDVDWQKIELATQNWDYKHAGLTQEGAIVVAIVVTILTWGAASSAGTALATEAGMTTTSATAAGASSVAAAGAGVAGSGVAAGTVLTTAGAAVSAAAAAGLTTLASQAAVSLINNQGDVGKTLQDLGSKDSVKQLVASMLTAGVTSGVTSALNLPNPTYNTSFAARFETYATRAAVSAGVQSAVFGTPLSETAKAALVSALAQTLTSEIGDFAAENNLAPGSAAKILAHAVVQCAAANVLGNDCGSAALGAAVAEALSPLASTAGQWGSAVTSMGAMLAASLTGKDALTALNAANTVDVFNRQLHPSETKWIKDNAKAFAEKLGISEEEATQRLTQQALKEVDYLWRAQLANGDDTTAKNYLLNNGQTFLNELGEQQKLFTAQGQQLFRPEMFADTADPTFYKQFAQSGVSRSLSIGLVQELKDSGIDLKNGTINFAQAVAQNPSAAISGLFDALTKLPTAIKDSFVETGQALGEGAAVAFNPDIKAKLNAIYGVDVTAYQQTLFALRLIGTATGALGAAKTTTAIGEKTVEVVAKQLDKVLDDVAQKTLLKSGGAFDNAGNALLDLKQLTNDQKRVMGELFGENTVKQIVPDGQKLARMQGTGTTGIDDLYKVNRPDVDYVNIEYKFVGTDSKTGASALGTTNDGLQGSETWTLGSNRLPQAVGRENAIAVENSIKAGRTETWVVTTRADGATEIQVLDSLGKPKQINTSTILTSLTNLQKAQP